VFGNYGLEKKNQSRSYLNHLVNEWQIAEYIICGTLRLGVTSFVERAYKGICYVRIVMYEIEGFPIIFLMIDRKINS
jgi:hypothetical protein